MLASTSGVSAARMRASRQKLSACCEPRDGDKTLLCASTRVIQRPVSVTRDSLAPRHLQPTWLHCAHLANRHAPSAGSGLISNAQRESADSGEEVFMPIRSVVRSSVQYTLRPQGTGGAPKHKGSGTAAPTTAVGNFFHKVQLAWRVFFPEEKASIVSAKEEGKRRLRMILVADRCGMSPASMSEMKRTIMRALAGFIDIDSEENIEVNISSDPGLGTVYSVAIPVRRVKPEARFGDEETCEGSADGITLEWDPADWNSNPSARFPMGC